MVCADAWLVLSGFGLYDCEVSVLWPSWYRVRPAAEHTVCCMNIYMTLTTHQQYIDDICLKVNDKCARANALFTDAWHSRTDATGVPYATRRGTLITVAPNCRADYNRLGE